MVVNRADGFPRLRSGIWVGILAVASMVALGISLGLGIREVGFPEMGQWLSGAPLSQEKRVILRDIRLPRLILAYLIGMALAGAGTALQSLFRNPLMDPFILGVSAGGALGAGLAVSLHVDETALGFYALPVLSFGGGLVSVVLAIQLSRTGRQVSIERLLLAGVALSSLFSALLSLLLVLRGEGLTNIIYWVMGGMAGRGWRHVLLLVPYVLLGLGLLAWNLHRLNVLQLGETAAFHLGIPVERVKLTAIGVATLLTAASVSVSGIIGFVGLMVPHLGRLLTGTPDLRQLLPVATLLGGLVLVAADTLARVCLPPQEIPVGIITALLGAPFFLALLYRRAG